MHHTGGASTLEDALVHVEGLKKQIIMPEQNAWVEPKDWDRVPGIVYLVPKSEFEVKPGA